MCLCAYSGRNELYAADFICRPHACAGCRQPLPTAPCANAHVQQTAREKSYGTKRDELYAAVLIHRPLAASDTANFHYAAPFADSCVRQTAREKAHGTKRNKLYAAALIYRPPAVPDATDLCRAVPARIPAFGNRHGRNLTALNVMNCTRRI